MACKLCTEFKEKYPLTNGRHRIDSYLQLSEIKCAYEDKFEDNWMCMTLSAIRSYCTESDRVFYTDDETYYTLPYDGNLYIIGSYKDRGNARFVIRLDCTGNSYPVTLEELETLIEVYKIKNGYIKQ